MESHLAGVLNTKVAETSNALDGNEVTGASAGIPQRIEDSDPGTEERRGFVGWKIVWHDSDRLGGSDHVLSVSSVEVDCGDLFELAVDEVAAAAGITNKAVSAMPADADALTRFPLRDVGTDFVDAAGDFVSGDARVLKARPVSLFDEGVTVADAAGLDFDADMAALRLR
ncbi:MAG TPA: hypothetical protein VJR03_14190, partial [Nitrospira sp.]|nr:hypothetical protein [Nitrospira sp.]